MGPQTNLPHVTVRESVTPSQGPSGLLKADRDRLFFIFFFAAYFFLVYQLLRILAPFLAPLLSAVMLALVVYPLRQLTARIVPQPTIAASLTTALVVATVILPFTLLVWLLVTEASTVLPAARDWLAGQPDLGLKFAQSHVPLFLSKLWDTVVHYAGMSGMDFKSVALETVREIVNRITVASAAMVGGFFVILFQFVVFLFALFFFLRDGPRIINALAALVPMEDANKVLVLASLDRTLVAMVRGTVITASAQGAATGLGLWIFGAPFPVLLGFSAAFLAVVPVVGAALVWIPAAVYLLLNDRPLGALGLVLWGLGIVGLIDNVIRPFVVGGQSKLPMTLLFLGVLGGVQVYGLIGGLLSPMLIACVFAFARIYRERYIESGEIAGSPLAR